MSDEDKMAKEKEALNSFQRWSSEGSDPDRVKGPAVGPIDPISGQHQSHWTLPPEELAKGFIRPVRDSYIHTKCGASTKMGSLIAETYARNPRYYGSTFCAICKGYFPVGVNGEFHWEDGSYVGS